MSEPKPFASLSSGLLARKGAAKPAMRPQGYSHIGPVTDDLGWNDMGHSTDAPGSAEQEHVPSSISALTPAGGARLHVLPVEAPKVVEQQRELEERFQAEQPDDAAEDELILKEPIAVEPPVTVALAPVEQPKAAPAKPKVQQSAGRKAAPEQRPVPARAKAAFTLRLEADRHLKLRLACAVTGRSAQRLVTEALDEFLNSRPDIAAMAQHLPAAGTR